MPQIEIRPMADSDIPVLVKIDHGYQSNYVWQMDRGASDDDLQIRFREVRLPRPVRVEYPRGSRWIETSKVSRSSILVGAREGKPVGYVAISEELSPNSSWITDLVVSTDDRRQGIATALILATQDWAIQHHHRRMIMEMQSKNYAAIRMARKLGFDFCGYNDQYYLNQDIALFFAQYLR